jgi:hypothetical protein
MKFPPNLLKLAKRLDNEARKLFPGDEEKQEEWYLEQFDAQLKDTRQTRELLRNIEGRLLLEATKDAYEQFPHDKDEAVVRILELMDWDNTRAMREIARNAWDTFLNDPRFDEERDIRAASGA